MNSFAGKTYHSSEIYAAAGRCVLADNYEYYYQLVDRQKISTAKQLLIKLCIPGSIITIKDSIGCCENEIILNTAAEMGEKDTVFIYCDRHIAGKVSGLYIPKSNIFITGDRQKTHQNLLCISLENCYYGTDRRRYTPQQYLKIAENYFEKSEYIDKMLYL